MAVKIALAGNPNCGKTTLFNALTGANQFVGNWPGVTVEKKEGKLKGHKDVRIVDLPGIYSLSPYTLEEVVARNYLIGEQPDAIINIIDGTNIERNLYLSTQIIELGIPVIMAVNMMDLVNKNGDQINIKTLGEKLGCEVVEISALKGTGVQKAAEKAVALAMSKKSAERVHHFDEAVEAQITSVEDKLGSMVPESQKRFFAIKLLERDSKIDEQLKNAPDVETEIKKLETEFDDDTESIITNERYTYISSIIDACVVKAKKKDNLTLSDKIDKVVTNRFLALPIFALVMFIVYYVSVTTVGTWATDWANDGVFGDGWHLFGIGSSAFDEDMTEYAEENIWTDELTAIVRNAGEAGVVGADEMMSAIEDQDFGAFDEAYGTYADALAEKNYDISGIVDAAMENAPDTSEYGVWVPGIPVLAEKGLDALLSPAGVHGGQETAQSLLSPGIPTADLYPAAQPHQLPDGCVQDGHCLSDGAVEGDLSAAQRHVLIQYPEGVVFPIPQLDLRWFPCWLFLLKPFQVSSSFSRHSRLYCRDLSHKLG